MSIIVLDSTTKSLKVNLSGAVANTNPSFVVTFADTTATAFTEVSSDGVLNGTSNVTVVAAPAIATRRVIKNLIIKNNDTAAVTVNLFLDNNGTSRNIARVTLAVDDTWTLSGTFSSNGSLKQTLGTNNLDLTGTTSAQALTVSGATTLSAGTANGILYLNGSKVATSGSALTFDGTALYINGGASGIPITLNNNTGSNTNLAFSEGNTAKWYLRNITGNGGFSFYDVNAGSEAMRLTSTGLGIGTSSPAQKLHVSGGNIRVSSASETTIITNGANFTTGAVTDSAITKASGSSLLFGTGSTEQMRLDSSGNLGLGVTPSAWYASGSGWKALQVGAFGILSNTATNDSRLMSNAYLNTGGSYIYLNSSQYATNYIQTSGQHQWFTAASGTAGNTITFTQAMTLDASGNLLVGTTTAAGRTITVGASGTSGGSIALAGANGGIYFGAGGTPVGSGGFGVNGAIARAGGTNFHIDGSVAGDLCIAAEGTKAILFGTSGSASSVSERARITSGGDLLVGTTSSSGKLTVIQGAALRGVIVGANSNGTSDRFFSGYSEAAVADTFRVYTNGNVVNTNSSYGSISDAKMKIDIVDAGSQWADIKAIRFRKFKMKNDPSGLLQLGVVAQELEQTSPGLVDEHADRDAEGNDLGTTTKSVKTSILLMKAAKALQEAMTRIETLEAKVATLEGTQP